MFNSKEEFVAEFRQRLIEKYGRTVEDSHITERYDVLGRMVRDYANINWRTTHEATQNKGKKQLIYFSMEFLIGRLLRSNLYNLGIYDVVKDGLADINIDIKDLENEELDAGLGNGGLGRLAACFMDSIASLGYPGHGNCIRYEYGFFKQVIRDGKQVEVPDQWLVNGNVWEVRKPKHSVEVMFYGTPETYGKPDGTFGVRTVNPVYVKAVPYDMAIVGYHNNIANNLRLWSAEPSENNLPSDQPFEDYLATLRELCHGLYPDDSTEKGKLLRLRQQYFLVSAGLLSATRGHYRRHKTLLNFHEHYVFQLNDTHPILAIPELMRIMMDDYDYGWDESFAVVQKTFAYTNHTVMAEALEKWPITYVQHLIPRCYMIIEELHRRSQAFYTERGFDQTAKNNMAIIRDGMIHMTNLAIYVAFSVNGVAYLHTEILKKDTFRDFYHLFPDKFNNKTNGVTHRRWFMYANPELSHYVARKIGKSWVTDPSKLIKLRAYADDPAVQKAYWRFKKMKKQQLADYIKKHNNIDVDINSIFDVQIKRLHAYKRQLLNIFRIMHLYFEMKNDPSFRIHPMTFIFGAKAAPSYVFAKKVIELILGVADVINNDEELNKYMKVIFIENYGVSNAEIIIPAADISEQISTAGKEASGTGNMKFMMNGALTLGTLDGANVEISQRVGDDNCFIFGLTEEEVTATKERGYNAWEIYQNDFKIHRLVNSLIDGTWANGDKDRYRVIFDELMHRNDEYLVFADLDAYLSRTDDIVTYYRDKKAWARSAIINIAESGYFSSDRTVEEYVRDIWHLKKVFGR
jgi:starch phosphorylase